MNPGDLVLFVDKGDSSKYNGVIIRKHKFRDTYDCELYPCLSNTKTYKKQYDLDFPLDKLQPLNSHKVRIRKEIFDFYLKECNTLKQLGYDHLFEVRGTITKANVIGTIPPDTLGDTLLQFYYVIDTLKHILTCSFSDVEFVVADPQRQNTCTCNILVLMNKGCQCGGV